MFKENYKIAMSFAVNEDLLRRTEEQMRAALAEPPKATTPDTRRRRTVSYRRVLSMAASVVVVVTAGVFWFRTSVLNDLSATPMLPESSPAAQEGRTAGGMPDAGVEEYCADGSELGGTSGAEPDEPPMLAAKAPSLPANDEASQSVLELVKISDTIEVDGMGVGGLLAREVEELLPSDSPWTPTVAAQVTALPVYWNPLTVVDGVAPERYLTVEEMRADAEQAALSLNVALNANGQVGGMVGFANDVKLNTSYRQDNITIFYDGNGHAELSGSCTPKAADPLRKELEVSEYYFRAAEVLVPMENPTFSHTVDYSYEGEPFYNIEVFDKSGSLAQQIVNYSLNSVTPSGTDSDGDGAYESGSLRYQAEYLGQELGVYPILTLEEAQTKLIQGEYQSGDGAVNISTDNVAGVTLVYMAGSQQQYHQPYYCFYVQLDPREAAGQNPPRVPSWMKTFEPVYVAAVRDELLNSRTLTRQ